MTLRVLSLALACALPVSAEPVDYTRDVKPIFAAHCVACHGPTKSKAELRLDLYSGIKEGGISGPAVVAGKPAESRFLQALAGDKDVTRMPPKGTVPAEQVAVLKRWVEEGARGPAQEEAVAGATKS